MENGDEINDILTLEFRDPTKLVPSIIDAR